MNRFASLLICLCFALGIGGAGLAQSQTNDDATLLERLIEEQLSSAGRVVTVRGFRGALSSKAQLDRLVVSDETGPWLTIDDAVLDWDRAALLNGRLEVNEISAREVALWRQPMRETGNRLSPEAQGFRLPDLPVSIRIDKINLPAFKLGADVLGIEAEFNANGHVSLIDGKGDLNIQFLRVDEQGPGGDVSLVGNFDNETRQLNIDFSAFGAKDGVISTLIGLPGTPEVSFRIKGAGPLDNFTGDLALSTDGLPRVTGRLTSRGQNGTLGIDIRALGDLTPLFDPSLATFFGPTSQLVISATQRRDGGVDLTDLRINAAALSIDGTGRIGPKGLPERMRLTGRIGSLDGAAVRLPFSDGAALRSGSFDLKFDSEKSADWTFDVAVNGFEGQDFSATEIVLIGGGQIIGSSGPQISADIDLRATGLNARDRAIASALGDALNGRFRLSWREGAPVLIDQIDLTGETYSLAGNALIRETERLEVALRTKLKAQSLVRFSAIAGRPLSGSAELDIDMNLAPIQGTFELALSGLAKNLTVDVNALDPLMTGFVRLEFLGRRDERGAKIERLTIRGEHVNLTGQADVNSGLSTAELRAVIPDLTRVDPELVGTGQLSVTAHQLAMGYEVHARADAAGSRAQWKGRVDINDASTLLDGHGFLRSADIAPFARVLNRDWRGAIDVSAIAKGDPRAQTGELALVGWLRDLRIGRSQIDGLLTGRTRIVARASRAADETIDVPVLRISGTQLRAQASGKFIDNRPEGKIDAELRELARVDARLSGPGRLRVDAGRTGAVTAVLEALATQAAFQGQLETTMAAPQFNGQLRAQIDSFAPLARAVNNTFSGRGVLNADGVIALDGSTFDVNAQLNAQQIRSGIAALDPLLGGDTNIALKVRRDALGAINLERLALESGLIRARADGALSGRGSQIDMSARIADIAPILAGFSGPATFEGSLRDLGERIAIIANSVGPADTRANLGGTVSRDFTNVDIQIGGRLSLALANPFIEPRTLSGNAGFDLTMNGPPNLSALKGRISTGDARLRDVTSGLGFDNIALRADLRNSQANLVGTLQSQSGGTISVSGPISLRDGYPADLRLGLRSVVIEDPNLFRTTANGDVTINGSLTGAARISGMLNLPQTDIQVPSTGFAAAGYVPDGLRHQGGTSAMRQTRAKAGLLAETQSARAEDAQSTGAPELDLTVVAPARIFVRGRGLDAELGGQARLGGTTNNIFPAGRFDLIRGRLNFLGQRIDLTEGSITMQGDLVPYLVLRAETETDGATLFVTVEGPADDPEITFSSAPELPQDEVLAQLFFGRSINDISPLQAALLADAVASLAGRSGAGVIGGLRQNFGLDDLDVNTDADGNAEVRAGRYLSENVYTDVTVGASGQAEINLNLNITESLTIRGGARSDGETNLGLFFEQDY